MVWDEIIKSLMDKDRLLTGYRKRRDETMRQRVIIENAIMALDIQNHRLQSKIDKLLDFYLNGNIDKDAYFIKRTEIEKEKQQNQEERRRTEERLKEQVILTPEQEESIETFQRSIACRLTPAVPFSEKLKLVDLLRIECVYNDETGELAGTGLIGNINCHPNKNVDV